MGDLSEYLCLGVDDTNPVQPPTGSEGLIRDKLERAMTLNNNTNLPSNHSFYSGTCDTSLLIQQKVFRSLGMDLRFTSKLDRDFLLDFHFQEPELFCKLFQNFRYTQDGLDICIGSHSPIVLKRGQGEIDVVYFEKISTIDAMSQLPYSSDELLILQSLLIALKRFYLPLKENI